MPSPSGGGRTHRDARVDIEPTIVRNLRAKGRTLHLADALIAATCLVHDLVIVTLNAKDFSQVDGLILAEGFAQAPA